VLSAKTGREEWKKGSALVCSWLFGLLNFRLKNRKKMVIEN
jgi:hypothetical protein